MSAINSGIPIRIARVAITNIVETITIICKVGLISPICLPVLRINYRGFRHVIRNVYTFKLRPSRLGELVLDKFCQFLENVVREDEI